MLRGNDVTRHNWVTLPPAGAIGSPHVGGHAGIRRARGTDRGAMASASRMARRPTTIPDRTSGHRPRRGARRPDRVRRGEGPARSRVRRSGGGSQLEQTAAVSSLRLSLDRAARPAIGVVSFRCRRSACRGRTGTSSSRGQRIFIHTFRLRSAQRLRILFGV
jgi:hypothetical protein